MRIPLTAVRADHPGRPLVPGDALRRLAVAITAAQTGAREVQARRLDRLDHVTSIYRWRGAVETTTEARAFLRSRLALLDELVAYVVERHPYEVPNVTALPIVGGNPDYLAWLAVETAGGQESAI